MHYQQQGAEITLFRKTSRQPLPLNLSYTSKMASPTHFEDGEPAAEVEVEKPKFLFNYYPNTVQVKDDLGYLRESPGM